ncbi:MAG: putative toxin-antitoxin system toxin component, PIN family [Puniceicoccales bacterium]|jgi:putative PIN family toxin of toxin-antitoxin system|nr:putative toxin-antitoxin system toxin component, PIN family [Puniceicoccales bacterium]
MGAKKTGVKKTPPRVVLDTNVVLSALLFRSGRMTWLANAWQNGRLAPLASRESVTELLRVLAYPKFGLDEWERQAVLGAYLPYAETTAVPEKMPKLPECRDAGDVKFLALARAGKADYLVTGDADLLAISGFKDCPILTPEAFHEIFEKAN